MIASGLGLLACVTARRRPMRFALTIAAVLLASSLSSGVSGRLIHVERSFFGVVRVTYDPELNVHRLFHGTTLHGQQSLTPHSLTNLQPTSLVPGRSARYSSGSGPSSISLVRGLRFSALVRGRWRPTLGPARTGRSTKSIRLSCGSPAIRGTLPIYEIAARKRARLSLAMLGCGCAKRPIVPFG